MRFAGKPVVAALGPPGGPLVLPPVRAPFAVTQGASAPAARARTAPLSDRNRAIAPAAPVVHNARRTRQGGGLPGRPDPGFIRPGETGRSPSPSPRISRD